MMWAMLLSSCSKQYIKDPIVEPIVIIPPVYLQKMPPLVTEVQGNTLMDLAEVLKQNAYIANECITIHNDLVDYLESEYPNAP